MADEWARRGADVNAIVPGRAAADNTKAPVVAGRTRPGAHGGALQVARRRGPRKARHRAVAPDTAFTQNSALRTAPASGAGQPVTV